MLNMAHSFDIVLQSPTFIETLEVDGNFFTKRFNFHKCVATVAVSKPLFCENSSMNLFQVLNNLRAV